MPELPLVGEEFAGYRLRAVLGRGGMSVVFRAENPRLGNVIALKVLAPELATDDIFRTRFLEESRIAAAMNHPNVIPIHDMGSSDGLLYLAMRCVNGTDLRQMIKKRGRLQPETAILLLSQAARALDAAHRDGLVHRDVKPGNLLVERGSDDADPEHLYLADFGITKHVTGRTGLTSSGQFMGTIDYVAPEQIRGMSVLGMADQYALGCVLYECLTGRVPFEKDLDAAIMYAHLEEAPTRPTHLRPDLPPAVDRVFARVLAKQPGDRYASCREFMAAARDALGPMADKPAAGSGLHAVHTGLPPTFPRAELVHEGASPPHDMTASVVFPSVMYPGDQGPGGRGPDRGRAGGHARGRRRYTGRGLLLAAAALVLVAGSAVGAVLASSGGGGTAGASGTSTPTTRPSATAAATATASATAAATSTMGPTTLAAVLNAANAGDAMNGMTGMSETSGELPPMSCKAAGSTNMTCTSPVKVIASAHFETFTSVTALYVAYEAVIRKYNPTHTFGEAVGNCGGTTPKVYGEIGWNHQEAHTDNWSIQTMSSPGFNQELAEGRIACFAVGDSQDIVWTADDGMMLGWAIGSGPVESVYQWWIDMHHNIIFPGTRVCGDEPLMKNLHDPNLTYTGTCARDVPQAPTASPTMTMTMAPSSATSGMAATASGMASPSGMMTTQSSTPAP